MTSDNAQRGLGGDRNARKLPVSSDGTREWSVGLLDCFSDLHTCMSGPRSITYRHMHFPNLNSPRLQLPCRCAVAAMCTRGTSSELSTLKHTVHPFASQSEGVTANANVIHCSNSPAWDGQRGFVYQSYLRAWSLTLDFHRPSLGPGYAGGTEFVVMRSVMSLQADYAERVSSFKNTERSNRKSRASTSCSCLP